MGGAKIVTAPAAPPASIEAPEFSAAELRHVAEEVSRGFPVAFERTELVMLPVDPYHLHAFWRLCPDDLESARRQAGTETAPLVLRLHEATTRALRDPDPRYFLEIEVQGDQGRKYIDLWERRRSVFGRLGLRAADGSLAVLGRSNVVQLPSDGPAAHYGRAALYIDPETGDIREIPDLTYGGAGGEAFPHAPTPQMEATDAEGLVRRYYERLTRLEARSEESLPTPSLEATVSVKYAPGMSAGGPGAPLEVPWRPVPGDLSPAIGQASAGAPTPPTEAVAPAAFTLAGPETLFGESKEVPAEPLEIALERVLALSLYEAGHETGILELQAEIEVYGRARPGTILSLFGRRVLLRPDGSFSLRQAVPRSAVVIPLLRPNGWPGPGPRGR